jgi:integrase
VKKPFLAEGLLSSATLTGLEPATSAVTGRHANQLRYRAKLVNLSVRPPVGIVTPTGFEPVLPP